MGQEIEEECGRACHYVVEAAWKEPFLWRQEREEAESRQE